MHEEIRSVFDEIKAEEQLKIKTKNYIRAQYAKPKSSFFIKKRYVSLAFTCFVLLISIIGYRFYYTASSIVSIDINPSLELEINYFGKVISAKGYNEDGNQLLDSLNVLYCQYDEAIDEIMKSQTIQECMNNDEYLSIAVVNIYSQQSDDIVSYVSNCHYYNNSNCYSLDMDDVEAAHETGLSYGKYQLYLQIKAVYDDITTQEIQNMSMKEIRLLMEQLGLSGEHHDDQSNQQMQTGNGNEHHEDSNQHRYRSHH